ncbi:MAG TPA: hypothetical protein VH482_28245 [Thermomicrobiales bacterium]|jgi:serine/threonine protein kinase
MDLFTADNRLVVLGPERWRGGEGSILAVHGHPDLVAKCYDRKSAHDAAALYRWSDDAAAKLQWMIDHRPTETSGVPGHSALAWPTAILFDDHRILAGFLMPYVHGALTAFDIYNRSRRRELNLTLAPVFPYKVARNLAAAVASLHAMNYVVGDLNELNVLVTKDTLVTLIDVDSFQVTASAPGLPTRIFRCPVGKDEYTAPELIGKPFAQVDRSPQHDRFALAVLIFRLLMDGNHPFRGRWLAAGDSPSIAHKIKNGWFPHASHQHLNIEPPPHTRSLDSLDPALAALMRRCFEQGHSHPDRRPTADEWRHALGPAADAIQNAPPPPPPAPPPLPPQPRKTVRPVRQAPGQPAWAGPSPQLQPTMAPIAQPARAGGTPWLKRSAFVLASSIAALVGYSTLMGVNANVPSTDWCSIAPFVSCEKQVTPTHAPVLVLEIECCPESFTSVAVRKNPDLNDFTGAKCYKDGTRVTVLKGPESHGGQIWYRVRVQGDLHEGWVGNWQLTKPSQTTAVAQNAGGVPCGAQSAA